jgi:hypothetical protein
MKLFLQKIGLFLALVVMTFVVATWLPDLGNRGNLLYSLIDKHERLDSIEGPRLIFVGGSNLLFGLDSRLVEAEISMPVVNLGMHAGAGLRFMLNHSQDLVREGDIVVLSPEYAHFYDRSPSTYDGQDELLTMVLDVYPAARGDLSLDHWLALSRYMPNYVGNKYFSFFRYWLKPKTRKGKFTVYMRDQLNAWGDVVGHLPGKNQPFPAVGEEQFEVDPRVLPHLNRYAEALREQGAQVYLTPTAFQASSYRNTQATVEAIEHAWHEKVDIEVLGNPWRYRFPDDMFWDSPEHLNRHGRELRTKYLIADLQSALASQP